MRSGADPARPGRPEISIRRFPPYPIHVSGSSLDEDFRAFVERIGPWLSPETKDWLIRRSTKLYYVNDDRPAARLYEQRVQMVLAEINATEVGKTLLGFLPHQVPIWIIRYGELARKVGGGAITGQMSSDHTKGVRIQYSPEMWLPGTTAACIRATGRTKRCSTKWCMLPALPGSGTTA
jgi:hypothetical protein